MLWNKKGNVAKPMTECIYPKCDKCEHFITQPSEGGKPAFATCDVPVVVSKQMLHDYEATIYRLGEEISEINEYVAELHAAMKDVFADKQEEE